jgi:hypothetical protein
VLFTLALQGGGLLMDKIMAWGITEADWDIGTMTISTSPVPGPGLPYETVGVRQLAAGFLQNLVLLEV